MPPVGRAAAASPRSGRGVATAGRIPRALGFPFILMLIWLTFEFARPHIPLRIPMIISAISLGLWIMRKDKQWAPHTWWFLVFLGGIGLMIPFAANSFWAYQGLLAMSVLFITIIFSLQSLVTTVKHVKVWAFTLVAVISYVAMFAMRNNGYGPAGSDGAQDENYVAAMIGMAAPFAYYLCFVDRRWLVRVLLFAALAVFSAAMVAQDNVSRGGFLGLISVVLYCLWRSPRKLVGFTVIGVAAVVFALLAGETYWAEIRTTTDLTDETADVRLEIWKMGFRMWQAYPILGVGANNFRWVLDDFTTTAQLMKFGRSLSGSLVAHSMHVELLAELGLVGVVSSGMLAWSTWRGLGKVQRDTAKLRGTSPQVLELKSLGMLADALRASILAVMVNGIFLSLLYYSHIWLLIAVGSAVPFVYRRHLRALTSVQAPAPPLPARVPPVRPPAPQPLPATVIR